MAIELRKTGISVVGDVPWGTHFCYFYETTQDLLDTLVPYFTAGLKYKEFCLWIISNSELLTVEDAKEALGQSLPDLERYLAEGSMEIVTHDEWFHKNGNAFDLHRVANQFTEKLHEALSRGYAGVRVNGSPAWLQKEDRKRFCEFEQQLDNLFPNQRVIASCTYPLACKGYEIFDVTRRHQFAIAKRCGQWEVVETPELKHAKAEIERLNEDLEQRVIERTRELAATNAELRKEITERKHAEDALQRSEDYLRLVINTIPTMAWSLRPDGVLDFVNQRWLDYTGLSFEKAIEEPTRTVHPEDLSRATEKWLVVKATSEAYEDEMRLERADGEYRWFLVRIAPLRDDQGNLVKRYGVAIDIEERKRAEEKLRQSESQLAEAQRMAHVGSWDYDLSTNKVRWSDELYRIFGLEPGTIEVAGDAMQFIHPDDRDLVFQTVTNAIKNREPYSFYYRVLRPDGDERVLHSRGFIVSDENGDPIKLAGATQDVTELKRAEEELKATSEQLRALSARLQSTREEEGRRIARELHDELGSALTSLRWGLDEIDSTLSTTATKGDANTMHRKIAALTTLVEGTVHTVRRISSELRPSILDDLGLVATLEWETHKYEARTGITSHFDSFVRDVHLTREQSTAVFRIFQEALTNVIRHAEATTVEITVKEQKGEFVLQVEDNGKGMKEADISGTESLGLLGMRERAHLIGGEVSITSAEGRGTVVAVRVPIAGRDLVRKMTR